MLDGRGWNPSRDLETSILTVSAVSWITGLCRMPTGRQLSSWAQSDEAWQLTSVYCKCLESSDRHYFPSVQVTLGFPPLHTGRMLIYVGLWFDSAVRKMTSDDEMAIRRCCGCLFLERINVSNYGDRHLVYWQNGFSEVYVVSKCLLLHQTYLT
jgi:hypothetical protein